MLQAVVIMGVAHVQLLCEFQHLDADILHHMPVATRNLVLQTPAVIDGLLEAWNLSAAGGRVAPRRSRGGGRFSGVTHAMLIFYSEGAKISA